MHYQRKSFTIAVSDAVSGAGAMCLEKGHSAVDSRGRCLCCGAKVGSVDAVTQDYGDLLRAEDAIGCGTLSGLTPQ